MDPTAVLTLASSVLNALPMLLNLGVDVSTLISKTNAVLSQGSDPTPAQWAEIDAEIAGGIDALKARYSILAHMPAPAESTTEQPPAAEIPPPPPPAAADDPLQ